MLRDIGGPKPVRGVGGEDPLDQVVVDRRERAGAATLAAMADPLQAGACHQPGDTFASDLQPLAQAQLGVDPRSSVGLSDISWTSRIELVRTMSARARADGRRLAAS